MNRKQCPFCGSVSCIRKGFQEGHQRWKCKQCLKKFIANNVPSAGRFLVSGKDFRKGTKDGNVNNVLRNFRQTKQPPLQKRSCFVCMYSTSKRSRKSVASLVYEPRMCRNILMTLSFPRRNTTRGQSRFALTPRSSDPSASSFFVIRKKRKICGGRFVTKSGHSSMNGARISCLVLATLSPP